MWKDKDISTLGLRAMSNVKRPSPEFSGVILKGHKAIPRYLFTANQMEAYANALAAERVREALEQAAAAVERHDKKGREFVKGSLWDQLSKETSDRIRALIPKQ